MSDLFNQLNEVIGEGLFNKMGNKMSAIDYKGFGFSDEDDFLRWRTSFYPDAVYKLKRIVDDEDDNDSFDLIDCLYTDGDDGVMKFTSFSEVFDSDGVSVELVDCQYCDLSFKFMEKISRKMKKFNQGK